MKRPAVFFDRDNTLIVSDGYLGDPARVVLISGAAQAVARARRLGYAVVVFSNQSGVARGMFSEEDVEAVNQRMDELLKAEDASAIIDRHEYCPFHPEGTIDVYARESDRRKPRPGMIHSAAKAMALDLERSWVVGDAARDIEAGKSAGCRAVLFRDPSLKKSPAAEKESAIEPDFVVSTLVEAMEYIEEHRENPEAAVEGAAAENAAVGQSAAGHAVAGPSSASDAKAMEKAVDAPGEHDDRGDLKETGAGAESATATKVLTEDATESVPPPTAAVKAGASLAMFDASAPASPAAAAPTVTPAPTLTPAPIRETAPMATNRSASSNTQNVARASSGSVAPQFAPAAGVGTVAAKPSAEQPKRVPKVAIGSKYVPPTAPGAAPARAGGASSGSSTSFAGSAAGGSMAGGSSASNSTPSPSVAEPVFQVRPAAGPAPAPRKPAAREDEMKPAEPPPTGFERMENLLEQIFLEVRRSNDQHEGDFSVSKLMAGVVQVIVLAILFLAYLNRANHDLLQTHLLLAVTLQTLTATLLIMSRQK